MISTDRSLIGSVFERKASTAPTAPSPRFTHTPGSGFPAVHHRSKSAFARAREEETSGGNARSTTVPSVLPTRPAEQSLSRDLAPANDDAIRRQISEENERRVATMSEDEREQERREIIDQLGNGVGDLLERVRAARSRNAAKAPTVPDGMPVQKDRVPDAPREIPIVSPSPGLGTRPNLLRVKSLEDFGKRAPPILVSSTRPPTPNKDKASRKLRFAAVTPEDVHVYESAPVSPKRRAFALPPPPDTRDPSILSLGTFKENGLPRKRPLSLSPEESKADKPEQAITNGRPEPEEGTPEYIRRRYFPNVPAEDPSVSWMKPSSSHSEPVSLRFDLTGVPIPAEISATLPSHLGLHHHADGNHAGYTLDDVFLLSRSTVPAQRTTMLSVLAGIARRLGMQARDPHYSGRITELQGKEEELRKRILAAGLSAMNERGGVGVRAIEVVWECLVGWDPLFDADRAELVLAPATMSTLQVPDFLTQTTELLAQSSLPPESMAQLLSIVYRLSQESNAIAEAIMKTPRLLPTLLQTFLLTPIPPPPDTPLPNPVALRLLIVLASSSRTNAAVLCEPTDALLRFITTLPPTSPFPEPLATILLTQTLRLYATLASYGLYSHIATAAASYFTSLSTYVVSSSSRQLKVAWAGLVEAWIVCATDPHHTTPSHDILWSQVASWGWGAEVLELRKGMTETEAEVWAAIWGAASAWLEGARINGIKGGEGERAVILSAIQDGFNKGVEGRAVGATMDALRTELAQIHEIPPLERYQRLQHIGMHAHVLSSVVRLWLACTPVVNTEATLCAPPFNLPFTDLSSLSALVVSYPIWSLLTRGVEQASCRFLACFLAYFHRLSRHIPGTLPDLWVAQGLTILRRLLPGDEDHAFYILKTVLAVLTPQFLGTLAPPSIWEKGGWNVIKPFLDYAIRPNREVYICPSDVTPESIMRSTTLRLPPSSPSSTTDEHRITGLPLSHLWLTSPIDHLLRSGSSPVFKALPSGWDASEVDVVRTSLLLAKATQDILVRYSLSQFALMRSEMVFTCMKVFMLEHGQAQEYSSPATGDEEEVFRDVVVTRLMSDLLAPFTLGASSASSTLPDIDLEQASLPFLGQGTPFYQFYTDFVALYDAISFSHPIFASLLIPPLALTYPIDYRRLVWGDFAHVLRTVRTPVDQVIAGDLKDFLYPIEQGEMIGKYVGALLQGSVDEFLRLVAVHHVACNIWPDLRLEEVVVEQEDVARKLLKVVVEKGDGRTVREVLRYRQVRGEAVVYPPACFETSGEWLADRATFAHQVLGSELHERLQSVFNG